MGAGRDTAGNLGIDDRVGVRQAVFFEEPPGHVGIEGRVRGDADRGEPVAHAPQVLGETVLPPAVETRDFVDRVGEHEATVLRGDLRLLARKVGAVQVDDHGVIMLRPLSS